MECLSADVLPILDISLFFRKSRYRANKKRALFIVHIKDKTLNSY